MEFKAPQIGNARDTHNRWRYPNRFYEPLQWYYKQLVWPSGPLNQAEYGVTFLELAVDFEIATRMTLNIDCEFAENELQRKAMAMNKMSGRLNSMVTSGKLWGPGVKHAPVVAFMMSLVSDRMISGGFMVYDGVCVFR